MGCWFAYSPISKYWDGASVFVKPISLSERVRVDKIPSWALDDQVLEVLDSDEREKVRDASFAICVDYEAESLGSPDPERRGTKPRSIQQAITDEILLVPLAFWLIRPTLFYGGSIIHLHRDENSAIFRQMMKGVKIRLLGEENQGLIQKEDLEPASQLFTKIVNLPKSGTVWMAIRMLHKTLAEGMWEVRFLLNWLVLESLFGPEDPRETTYRLSQRLAFFVATDRQDANSYFKLSKDLYKWRSKIVHGLRLQKLKEEPSLQMAKDLESLIRLSFTKILMQNHMNDFDSNNRETFLDDLVFSNE